MLAANAPPVPASRPWNRQATRVARCYATGAPHCRPSLPVAGCAGRASAGAAPCHARPSFTQRQVARARASAAPHAVPKPVPKLWATRSGPPTGARARSLRRACPHVACFSNARRTARGRRLESSPLSMASRELYARSAHRKSRRQLTSRSPAAWHVGPPRRCAFRRHVKRGRTRFASGFSAGRRSVPPPRVPALPADLASPLPTPTPVPRAPRRARTPVLCARLDARARTARSHRARRRAT